MSRPKLSQRQIVDLLFDTARKRVLGSTCSHPVDIANALTFSIEAGGDLLDSLSDAGLVDWERAS